MSGRAKALSGRNTMSSLPGGIFAKPPEYDGQQILAQKQAIEGQVNGRYNTSSIAGGIFAAGQGSPAAEGLFAAGGARLSHTAMGAGARPHSAAGRPYVNESSVSGGIFERDEAQGGPADIGPQLTVGVPLWTRNQGGIGTSRAELDRAGAELESVRARVGAELAVLPEVGTYAAEALGRLGDFEQDAREALASIELGWTTGEIGVSEAVLLRREVLDGWVAALDARQSTVEARLDVLLANEDPNLIPADSALEDR